MCRSACGGACGGGRGGPFEAWWAEQSGIKYKVPGNVAPLFPLYTLEPFDARVSLMAPKREPATITASGDGAGDQVPRTTFIDMFRLSHGPADFARLFPCSG